MNLPDGFSEETYIEIWYSDLAKVVEKHFGGQIDMAVVMDFPSQDSYRVVNVPTERYWATDWLVDSENDSPELIIKAREYLVNGITRGDKDSPVDLDCILDLLHEDGLIPEGKYLVTIYW